MSKLGTFLIWALAAGFLAALLTTVVETVRRHGLEPDHAGPGPAVVVLEPLEAHSGTRAVETRLPGFRVRRLCGDGRCELLAGRDGGFELLASYPADRYVAVERGPQIRVRDLGRRDWRPPTRHSPNTLWLAVAAMGAALAVLLFRRSMRLSVRLAALRSSRDAIADDEGVLRFLDNRLPRAVRTRERLPPGLATGLHPVAVELRDDTAYREHTTMLWTAVSGSRDANLARVAASRGATLALSWAMAASAAAAVAATFG